MIPFSKFKLKKFLAILLPCMTIKLTCSQSCLEADQYKKIKRGNINETYTLHRMHINENM